MNNLPAVRHKLLPFILLSVLIGSLIVSLVLVKQRQEIRKKAGGSQASGAQIILSSSNNPSQSDVSNLKVGENQYYDLKVIFTGGSADEKFVFFKTEIDYDTKFIQLVPDESIDISMSGLDRIIKLDEPEEANNAGKITIYLGAIAVDSAPNTSQPVTIAKIRFQGREQTSSVQNITIGDSQVVNEVGAKIPYKVQNLSYNVIPADSITGEPSITNIPISSPISPPISGTPLCPLKSIGDANCDGKVDLVDYKIWREEYDTMVAPNPVNQNADFACVEGNKNTYFVDMVDYEIWRRNTKSGLITPTPTPSLTPTPSNKPIATNTPVPT